MSSPRDPLAADARLLADIGGTHVRFGWQARPGAPIDHVREFECEAHPGVLEAIRHWIECESLPSPAHAALAVATPVQGEVIRLTNGPWSFSTSELKSALSLNRLLVVNDFTALALALPRLDASELQRIGGADRPPFSTREPVALLGAGTGLGVSGLLPSADMQWTPIAGEGGHVSLATHDAREARVLGILQDRFVHVSAERVLSGDGLRNLWAALMQIRTGGWPKDIPSASTISQMALHQQDAQALEVIDVFCGFLGHVAGDLALTLGATGGVFIGGGIIPRWGHLVGQSRLRACFEAKGRYREYLAAIPIWTILTRESPALRGVAQLLDATGPSAV